MKTAHCPTCGKTDTIDPKQTQPRDYLVCDACGTIAIWDGDLMRHLTDAEVDEFLADAEDGEKLRAEYKAARARRMVN
jgi:hypothetical protein